MAAQQGFHRLPTLVLRRPTAQQRSDFKVRRNVVQACPEWLRLFDHPHYLQDYSAANLAQPSASWRMAAWLPSCQRPPHPPPPLLHLPAMAHLLTPTACQQARSVSALQVTLRIMMPAAAPADAFGAPAAAPADADVPSPSPAGEGAPATARARARRRPPLHCRIYRDSQQRGSAGDTI